MDNSEFAQSSAAERELLPPERKGSGVWPWMFALIAIAAALWARTMWRPADDEPRGEKHPAVGTPLFVDIRGRRHRARVVPKPFYRRRTGQEG